MSSDESRRFTDREVAIILKKAAEIDENEGKSSAGGLSIDELKEVAVGAGISPSSIEEAARRLEKRPSQNPLRGSPLVRRSVHAVSGELNTEAIARLIRLVDERTDATGSVTEALGSVRWTSRERFRSQQVDITPQAGETRIQVVEKIAPRLRRVLHLLPAAWGLMIAGPIVSSAQGVPASLGIVVAVLSAAAGAAVGRGIFATISSRSAQRVERLAADVAREAHDASRSGLLAAPAGPDEGHAR
jgi:hypothetical protein